MYLYIGCNSHVSAIDPNDGREVWRVGLNVGLLGGRAEADVCILEHQGKVFAGCNGHLFAFDGQNGQLLWHNELEGMGYNEVTLAIDGKSIQYVSSRSTSSG
jgi:outer membrane protein assembly factor BamB